MGEMESRNEVLKEIKKNSMRRVYTSFKAAEANGTLRRLPLTPEEKRILGQEHESHDG